MTADEVLLELLGVERVCNLLWLLGQRIINRLDILRRITFIPRSMVIILDADFTRESWNLLGAFVHALQLGGLKVLIGFLGGNLAGRLVQWLLLRRVERCLGNDLHRSGLRLNLRTGLASYLNELVITAVILPRWPLIFRILDLNFFDLIVYVFLIITIQIISLLVRQRGVLVSISTSTINDSIIGLLIVNLIDFRFKWVTGLFRLSLLIGGCEHNFFFSNFGDVFRFLSTGYPRSLATCLALGMRLWAAWDILILIFQDQLGLGRRSMILSEVFRVAFKFRRHAKLIGIVRFALISSCGLIFQGLLGEF